MQYDDATEDTIAGAQVTLPLPIWNRNQGGVAKAQAEGNYKVALERCDGLPAAEQSSCRDAAKAERDRAEGAAKQ